MGRRRKVREPLAPRPNAEWTYLTETQINGRHVSVGTELKIKGERGRYRFLRIVQTPSGKEWLDAWGGPKGAEQWRSFAIDKVKTVHYKNTTYQALAEEYKAKKASLKEDRED